MFKKITNLKGSRGNIKILGKQIEFKTRPDDEFYGIKYYDVESDLLQQLYKMIPEEWHKDFYSSFLIINDDLPPHTDIVETAGLNCYIQSGKYITNFYDNRKLVSGKEYADHGEGHIFNRDELQINSNFLAEDYDVYLLNNKKIHEVVSQEFAKPTRKVLQLATNKYSYEEVLEKIGESYELV